MNNLPNGFRQEHVYAKYGFSCPTCTTVYPYEDAAEIIACHLCSKKMCGACREHNEDFGRQCEYCSEWVCKDCRDIPLSIEVGFDLCVDCAHCEAVIPDSGMLDDPEHYVPERTCTEGAIVRCSNEDCHKLTCAAHLLRDGERTICLACAETEKMLQERGLLRSEPKTHTSSVSQGVAKASSTAAPIFPKEAA